MAMKVLRLNCMPCHNEEKRKGGLLLTTRASLLEGGDEGAAILEGKPEESRLIQSLAAGVESHMPPKKQLPASQIKLLADWVRAGALWDEAALAGMAPAPRAVALAPVPAAYRPVMALALSPDGSRLAVGCRNEVVLFEVGPDSLKFLGRASAHLDPVQSIAWMPDGKQLVTGAFRRVVVWNAVPFRQEREISTGLTDRIMVLRALPDGRQVLLADGLVAEADAEDRHAAGSGPDQRHRDAGLVRRAWARRDDDPLRVQRQRRIDRELIVADHPHLGSKLT